MSTTIILGLILVLAALWGAVAVLVDALFAKDASRLQRCSEDESSAHHSRGDAGASGSIHRGSP